MQTKSPQEIHSEIIESILTSSILFLVQIQLKSDISLTTLRIVKVCKSSQTKMTTRSMSIPITSHSMHTKVSLALISQISRHHTPFWLWHQEHGLLLLTLRKLVQNLILDQETSVQNLPCLVLMKKNS